MAIRKKPAPDIVCLRFEKNYIGPAKTRGDDLYMKISNLLAEKELVGQDVVVMVEVIRKSEINKFYEPTTSLEKDNR